MLNRLKHFSTYQDYLQTLKKPSISQMIAGKKPIQKESMEFGLREMGWIMWTNTVDYQEHASELI